MCEVHVGYTVVRGPSRCVEGTSQCREMVVIIDGIAGDQTQKAECRQEARGLVPTMGRLETGMLTVLWNQVL